MSSPRKLSANRSNARRSTGPRTSQGKARSKRNSWQHGLSVKQDASSPSGLEVQKLAAVLAGPNADPVRLHFATIAAEAEIELLRVRAVRKLLIGFRMMGGPDRSTVGSDTQAYREALPDLLRLDRYERRASSRRNRAMPPLARESGGGAAE
jgi:hypothetical protein